ncbi:alpha/beta hydrolase [Williamsia sp. R60]
MIHVIDKGAAAHRKDTPLLFVHGGSHSAWCWEEHFLDYFVNVGYRAVAVDLRGHGESPTSKPLNSCSIADYVQDVRSVAQGLPTEPILIGHSMGGFIVQKYLETRSTPAAVLVSTAPPRTFVRAGLRTAFRQPWISLKIAMTRNPARSFGTPASVRKMLFRPDTPEEIVQKCFSRIGPESYRAVCQDMIYRDLVRPNVVTTPMLILEGEEVYWGKQLAQDTATAYHTEPEYFPDMGHNMMLEPGWASVAERIHQWLTARHL